MTVAAAQASHRRRRDLHDGCGVCHGRHQAGLLKGGNQALGPGKMAALKRDGSRDGCETVVPIRAHVEQDEIVIRKSSKDAGSQVG